MNGERNRFLDGVRAIAVVRVVAWHAHGVAPLSWLAAMPVMFFAGGALVARSLDRSPARAVIVGRLRRLLPPLWLYGAAALGLMAATAGAGSLRWWQPLLWAVPLWDPSGTAWGAALWVPLWYLRCYLWLLLASPLLHRATGRRPSVTLAAIAVAFAGTEVGARAGVDVPWQLRDLALFAGFWVLGMRYQAGAFARIPTTTRAWAAVGAGTAAIAWWATAGDIAGGIVHTSYPAHLAAGVATLFAALAAERPLARLGSTAAAAWVNRRALSIYLWHSLGFLVMARVVAPPGSPAWVRHVLGAPVLLVVTAACVLAAGWVEDVAAGRRASVWPAPTVRPARRRALAAATAACTIVAGLAGGGFGLAAGATGATALALSGDDTAAALLPLSGRVVAQRAAGNVVLDGPPPARQDQPRGEALDPAEVRAVVERWWADSAPALEAAGTSGVAVAVAHPGEPPVAAAVGTSIDGATPGTDDDLWPLASTTKFVTATLLAHLAEQGVVGLDDPLDAYVPEYPHAASVTLRQLAMHQSGVPAAIGASNPREVMAEVFERPLSFEPGEGVEYSDAGMYLLGWALERATGSSYGDLVAQIVTDPLGLAGPVLDDATGVVVADEPTHPEGLPTYFGDRWSTGGLWGTAADTAAMLAGIFGTDTVLGAWARDEMTAFDPRPEMWNSGLATYPRCPCWSRADGRLAAGSWSTPGAYGDAIWDDDEGLAVVFFTNSWANPDGTATPDFAALQERLLDLARHRPSEA